jgi:hypothetical protein
MNLYLNYAREPRTNLDEHPPIGLILCSEHDNAVAHYALGNLVNQVVAVSTNLHYPRKNNWSGDCQQRH